MAPAAGAEEDVASAAGEPPPSPSLSPPPPPQQDVLTEEEYLLQGCPDDYICPLSLGLLEDPVIAMDGQTYSNASITAHIDHCASKGKPLFSPMSNESMEVGLVPNVLVRRMVSDYLEAKRKEWQEMQQGQQQEEEDRREGKKNY